MSKKATVEFIAASTGVDKKDVESVLAALPDAMVMQLRSTQKAVLNDVCSMSVTHRAARKGRNPKTGDIIDIAARDVVTVKAAGKVKKSLA